MSKVTGKVTKVYPPNKGGFSSIYVAGADGKFTTKQQCSEGDYVEFEFSKNGNYQNINDSTFKKVDPPKNKPKGGGGYNELGVKIGHAINNAVQIAAAAGDTDINNIESIAFDIYDLSLRMESQLKSGKRENNSVPFDGNDVPSNDNTYDEESPV